MEQNDRSYHTADRSSRSYAYAGQPHHVRGVPQTYYELAPLMEHSLSTHYPESSQRSITHSTSYSSTYDPSPFRAQSYDSPDDPFDNNPFQHTSPDHTPSHVLHHFSDLAVETNSSTLHAETEIYTSSTPRTAEVGPVYAPNTSFISQHNTSTNPFAFTSMPSNAYVQVAQPSVGCATGPAVAEESARHLLKRGQMSHVHYTGDLAQVFTPRQLPFDRKHMYTREADASDASAPDPPVKLADLDVPHPSLSLSHQFSDSNAGTSTPLSEDPVPPPVAIPKKKKSKMHDCEICHKKFPRPSGLRTHMNIHNNVRPYPCTFPGCNRKFAVRSNAKRHLRTHGIIPAPASTSSSLGSSSTAPYVVGFSPPTIVPPSEGEMHQMRRAPFTLKWMPPSLSKMSNAGMLRPVSDVEDSDADDDEYDEFLTLGSNTREESTGPQTEGGGSCRVSKRGPNREGRSALSIPLRPVVPTSPPLPLPTLRCAPFDLAISSCGGVNFDCYARYEERNSFREAGSHPYHPAQFRVLPGPAVIRSSLVV